MHSYQVDVDKRNKPLWVIMGIASFLTAAIVSCISTLKISPFVKSLIPAPSAFFIFLVLYWAFDNWLWKWSTFKYFFGISEPNVEGVWEGKLKSNTYQKEIPITLTIKQRWSKISIAISFNNSTSSSFSAAILCSKALPVLTYNYENNPHHRESDTMTRHIGTAELVLKDKNTLVGNYFNSGERKTEGAITVVRG